MTGVAVHFGAGNIGRGFIGWLLARAGYTVVFADVNTELVSLLASAEVYRVREAGGKAHEVRGFRAVHSRDDAETLHRALVEAEVVTCAVGPTVLPLLAPTLARALADRPADAAPLVIMACENAVRATHTLRTAVAEALGAAGDHLVARALWLDTAVDRIVPAQPADLAPDVIVEPFFEWVIEVPPAPGEVAVADIPGAHRVSVLEPYIERKLFTVNTGHASTAYLGRLRGHTQIATALADPVVREAVEAVLEETSAFLVARHGLDAGEQRAYREAVLKRFANPALPDAVDRIGRQPLRKLGRNERFVGPVAGRAERGMSCDALCTAIGAALRYDAPDDPEAVELARVLRERPAPEVVTEIMGIPPEHPAFDPLRTAVLAAQR